MSREPSLLSDPFAIEPPDKKTELRALARALQFGSGFKLLFAQCNSSVKSRGLAEEVKALLPDFAVHEIWLPEGVVHLLDTLREELAGPAANSTPAAVFVFDLERSLPTAATAHSTPLIANLNAARNSFPLVVSCPLVLWVPDYVLTATMRGAPDFFSVRSGVFQFAALDAGHDEAVESLTAGEHWTAASLSAAEKTDRIHALKEMLNGFRFLPEDQRSPNAELRLHGRLGALFWSRGDSDLAREHFGEALRLAQTAQDRRVEAGALAQLGKTYLQTGQWPEAEAMFSNSLAIASQINDQEGITTGLINLGNVHYHLGRSDEAEASYRQALSIARQSKDRISEEVAMGNLGNLLHQQGNLSEAAAVYQDSLRIAREMGDGVAEGQLLNNLGTVFQHQGRLDEAAQSYQESLTIARELGNRSGEESTLTNLATLAAQRGHPSGSRQE